MMTTEETPKGTKIKAINGYWNPDGTGAFRLLGCRISGAMLEGQTLTKASRDPIIGMRVDGSNSRVAAKMVDLDPQQQMVSQIWGLLFRVHNEKGKNILSGDFEPAAFSNLWQKQQQSTHWFDQTLATAYQSVLNNVEWSESFDSPVLTSIRQLSEEGMLSIRMNVFGFDRTPGASDYATGVITGAIGPTSQNSPKFFNLGRHLTPEYADPYGFSPKYKIGPIEAVVEEEAARITVDLGNSLPISGSSGKLSVLSEKPLQFVILKDPDTQAGDTIDDTQIISIGEIPFSGTDWLKTAGIVSFDLDTLMHSWIEQHPVALVKAEPQDQVTVLNRETKDGLFVKADQFVFRMNPGDHTLIDFWTTQYGKPISTSLHLEPTQGILGLTGTGSNIDKTVPPPIVCQPHGVVSYPASVFSAPNGKASVHFSVSPIGPGNPRKYIDGQLYGIAYQFKDGTGGTKSSLQHFISVLVWDDFAIPEKPTWYQDVQPILQQYANLYPIMSHGLFNIADYDKVVQFLKIMELSFSLPLENPNSMPATRDMSANKRAMIVRWLTTKDPETGLPYLGVEPAKKEKKPKPSPNSAQLSSDSTPDSDKYSFARKSLDKL
ncbi:MAG: hypothetical protein R3B93_20835 [Bacteroidia bacterium]